MQLRTEIVNGKRRIIIIREASGVDKLKDAIEHIMPEYEFSKEKQKAIKQS
jgi:hypothetical protein